MADEPRGFVFVKPPDCAIGDAEARAIIARSYSTELSTDFPIEIRVSEFSPPGVVYIIDRDALDPRFDELWTSESIREAYGGRFPWVPFP